LPLGCWRCLRSGNRASRRSTADAAPPGCFLAQRRGNAGLFRPNAPSLSRLLGIGGHL
jgi:hypothetical protein